MYRSNQNNITFLLEEVFQLLLESLDHDPFSQTKDNASRKYIARLRQLLGQEFSFWLAETGSIYFSTLISAKKYADVFFDNTSNEAKHAKQIYDLLLHTSQLVMCVGLQSEKTINALIKLQALTTDNHSNLSDDISSVIENAVVYLQNCVYKQIIV